MPTTPLTASRVPDNSFSFDVAGDMTRAVGDLEDNTTPRFLTTAARDTAYANWVAAGNVLEDGLSCFCKTPGAYFDRIGGVWVRRGTADYVRAWMAVDLTQPANGWTTVPLTGFATEGRSGIYTSVNRNNTAYTTHPARAVVRFEVGGLYAIEGQLATDTVSTSIRIAKNIDGTLEQLAVSSASPTNGSSTASTTNRFAAGDTVALQGNHNAAYIVQTDGKSVGTPAYKVSTALTITRLGD